MSSSLRQSKDQFNNAVILSRNENSSDYYDEQSNELNRSQQTNAVNYIGEIHVPSVVESAGPPSRKSKPDHML